jgi:hypothetical protein
MEADRILPAPVDEKAGGKPATNSTGVSDDSVITSTLVKSETASRGEKTGLFASVKDFNPSSDPDSDVDAQVGPVVTKEDEPYPEGGIRAWLVVFGCWLALFASLGLMSILATFHTYVSANQLASYDQGTIGWIFSVYTFLSFFLGIYVGPIFDKYGPRWLIFAGTLCLVASSMLLSISHGESCAFFAPCCRSWVLVLLMLVLSVLKPSLRPRSCQAHHR